MPAGDMPFTTLERLAANVPGAIVQVLRRPDGTLAVPYASQGLLHLMGVYPETAREDAHAVLSRLYGDDLIRVEDRLRSSARDLAPWQDEFRAIHPTRGTIWLSVQGSPERLGDGSVLWSAYLQEVTERRQGELERAERAALFEAMFDFSTAAKLLVDPVDGRITKANAAACQFYGVDAGSVEGRLLADLDVEGAAGLTAHLATAIAAGGARVEGRHAFTGAGVRAVDAYFSPVAIAGRTLIHAIIIDVTEQLAARRQFELILDTVGEAILGVDAEGRISFVNATAEVLLDQPGDPLLGRQHHPTLDMNSLAGEPLPTADSPILAALATGEQTFRGDVTVTRGDGRRVPVEMLVNPATSADGSVVGAVASLRDVSERGAYQDTVRRLSQAVEQSPVSVVITNPTGAIVYANRRFCESSGYALEEVIGENPRVLKSGKTSEQEYAELWSTITSGGTWHGEFRNRRKDGVLYWERAAISPILDDHGRISYFLAVKEDISDEKAMAFELVQANKDLQETVDRLEIAREEAARADNAKSEFLAAMSHELRTPLNAILGFSEVIEKRIMGDDAMDIYAGYAGDIHNAGKHLLALVDDILDLSKIEAGRMTIAEAPVDIGRLVSEVTRMTEGRLASRDLRLDLPPPGSFPWLRADERMVRQMLMNLLSNAIKFTSPGGSVAIRPDFRFDTGGVDIIVRDTGRGMSADEVAQVGVPFLQSSNPHHAQADDKGTGLGLALVHRMMALHGGELVVTSELGEGTTVRLRFPPERALGEELFATLQPTAPFS